MTPYVTGPVIGETATQTSGVAFVIAMATTEFTTEAAAKVIVAKAVTFATSTITAVAGKCAGGKPGNSESK
jgi:hypothetical protein